MPATPGSGLRLRTPETWAAAGADYMAGLSATEVCERYDLALSTFRARVKQEGWRRADQADPEPPDLDDLDELDGADAATPAELAEIAWREAGRAVRRGLLQPARGWTRLTQELRAMAKMQADAARAVERAAASQAREVEHRSARQAYIAAAQAEGMPYLKASMAFTMACAREETLPVYRPEPCEAADADDPWAELEASMDEDDRQTALDRTAASARALDDSDDLDWRNDGCDVMEEAEAAPVPTPPDPAAVTPNDLSSRPERSAEPGPQHAAPLAAVPDQRSRAVRDDMDREGGTKLDYAALDTWPPPGLPNYPGLTVTQHERIWRDSDLIDP